METTMKPGRTVKPVSALKRVREVVPMRLVHRSLAAILPLSLALMLFAAAARAQAGLAWRQVLAESEADGRPEAPDVGPSGPVRLSGKPRCDLLNRLAAAARRGRAFLLSAQRGDGSWGVGIEHAPGWDETHMRVPITAQVLRALRESGEPMGGEFTRGRNFIARNMLRSRGELAQSETLPSNNDTPYALAYSLAFLLDEHERAEGKRRGYLRGKVQEIIDAMQETSWRYMATSSGQSTFQLAMMAEPLLQARQAGFRIPPAPPPASYDRPTDDVLPARAPAPGALERPKDMLDAILDLIAASRGPAGTFSYMTGGRDDDGAAGAARSVLCERLLAQAGHAGAGSVPEAVGRFMNLRRPMEEFLRTTGHVTHDPTRHNWARYYYFPGMQWTVDTLLAQPGPESEAALGEMGRALVDMQNRADGSWVDSPQASGPSYGTATAVLLLNRIHARLTSGGAAPCGR